ncbi:MAG: GAF domain-containing protein [Anaerolineae bacterium]
MEPGTPTFHLDSETRFRILHEALKALAQGPDSRTLAEMAVRLVTERLGYPVAAVVVRDPLHLRYALQALHPRALLEQGLPPEALAALRSLEEGIYPEARPGHQALLQGQPWVTDALADFVPEVLADAWERKVREVLGHEGRYVAVSAGMGKEILAVVMVGIPRREVLPGEADLLQMLCRPLAMGLERLRLAHRAEVLQRTFTALSRRLDLQELLEVAVRQAAEVLDAPAASLTLWDRETDTLRIVASHGLSEAYVRKQVVPGEKARKAAEAAGWKPFVIPDRAAEEWGGGELAAQEGLRTVLVIPLQVGEARPGSLNVYDREARAFSEEEVALATALGEQVATALHNARLYEETHRRLREMTALRELALQMAEPQPLEALLQRVVEEAARLAGVDAGSLYLLEETGTLMLAAAHNIRTYSVWSRPTAMGEGLCGRVAATGEPLAVEDYSTWPGRAPQWEDEGVRANVAVPLQWGGRILGVLNVSSHEHARRFSKEEMRLLELFAQQAAAAVENARLMDSLRQEKAFTERLLETASVLVVLLDSTGRILLFNRACEELTGYRKEEVLGANWFHLFIPERQREDLDRVFAGVKTGQAFHRYENPIRTRGGQERLVAWRNMVFWDAEGRVQQVLSVGQDVTEEREAEREVLRRSMELSLLVEAGQEFGRELDWERTLHRVARQAQELLEADSCTVFLLEEDGETLRPAISVGPEAEAVMRFSLKLGEGITGQVARKGVPELVNQAHLDPRAVHVPGTAREPESLLCAPLVARGRTIGILVLSRLGGRGFAPEDLRFAVGLANLAAPAILNARLYRDARQEAKRRADLFQSMAEGLVVLDPAYRIVDVNPAMCRMTGFAREELVGLEPPFPHWPPERVEEYLDVVRRMQARPQRLGPLELSFRRKGGETFVTLASISPIRNEEGELEGFLSVLQDITERKALEEQLRQVQKMEAIGTLAGGIAHDFNNILVGILGYASLLQAELPQESPLQKDVEVIIRSAHRAAGLSQQLLSFARRSQPHRVLVDLNALVEEVVTLLRQTTDRRIEVVLDLATDLLAVEGDASQLQQVVLNLGINACEAMPEGGRLTFCTATVEVSEGEAAQDPALAPGSYVLLEVADTGVGMDERTLQRIFEPFFTTKEHGRGLGLATVYGIVRAHGGSIRVESAVGRGTTFRVFLPAAGERVERRLLPVLDTRPLGGQETILVVDDEEDVRGLVTRVLRAEGYHVLQAEDGQRAVEVLVQCKDEVDLVMLDLIMPRMDGVETFRRLREIKPDARVLISSGYSPDLEGQALLEEGAAGFLQKPYDMDQVLRKVREVLNRS